MQINHCPFCKNPSGKLSVRRGVVLVVCTTRHCWAEGPRELRHNLDLSLRPLDRLKSEAVRRWNSATQEHST